MERREEEIGNKVSCCTVLEQAGFQIDARESTRRAVKYRRAGEIAIVTHGGRGWFDPLSDRKGDVFGLHALLQSGDFATTLRAVRALAGVETSCPPWKAPEREINNLTISERWSRRTIMRPGSQAFIYLSEIRMLPRAILQRAIQGGVIRQGPYGSAWFAHQDKGGRMCGWEERGPQWRGFACGGIKGLFRLGSPSSPRLCVTEAAIDALSLAAIERDSSDTLYASTAGGWSPATLGAVRDLAGRVALLVAATDRNSQGEAYADMLRQIAVQEDCGFQRLRPQNDDWNDDLKERGEGWTAAV